MSHLNTKEQELKRRDFFIHDERGRVIFSPTQAIVVNILQGLEEDALEHLPHLLWIISTFLDAATHLYKRACL